MIKELYKRATKLKGEIEDFKKECLDVKSKLSVYLENIRQRGLDLSLLLAYDSSLSEYSGDCNKVIGDFLLTYSNEIGREIKRMGENPLEILKRALKIYKSISMITPLSTPSDEEIMDSSLSDKDKLLLLLRKEPRGYGILRRKFGISDVIIEGCIKLGFVRMDVDTRTLYLTPEGDSYIRRSS